MSIRDVPDGPSPLNLPPSAAGDKAGPGRAPDGKRRGSAAL